MKIHIAVNVKSKEILSIKVTDERVHNSKALPELVDDIIKLNHVTAIGKVFADGTYDSNENFKYLKEKRIRPIIKVKRNSIISSKNSNVRNR